MNLSGQVICPQTRNSKGAKIVISYCPDGKSQFVDQSHEVDKASGEWNTVLDIGPRNTRIKVTYYPPDHSHETLEWDGVVTCDQGQCCLPPASLPPTIKTAIHFPVREEVGKCVVELWAGQEKQIPRASVKRGTEGPAYVGWLMSGNLESEPVTVEFPDGTKEQGRLRTVPGKPGLYQFSR
jgi:hypothetical protein